LYPKILTVIAIDIVKSLSVGRERKSRKSTTRKRRISSSSRTTGRPDRSTGVHQRAQGVAVDRPVDRRRRTVDRSVDRLTLPNSRLGTVDRHGRAGLGSVDRPVDRQTDLDSFWKVF